MILNILMIVVLYILTFYIILISNIIYGIWSEVIAYATSGVVIVGIYGVFILWVYLLYVLVHGIYKKKIHKNYGYSYLAFFPIFLVFYFGYYTYDNNEFVPETLFETKLQNIEVKEEENGLMQLGKKITGNDEIQLVISELREKLNNNYYCLTGDLGKKCEEEDLNYTLEQYKLEYNTIELVNNEISKIIEYKYFKEEISDSFTLLKGLPTIAKISLFSAIYQLEEGNEDKAIKTLLIYKKLGDKILEGDTSLTGVITGTTIERIFDNNINYILDNYNIDIQNIKLLKNELSNIYNGKEIIENIVKIEYWLNKYSFEKGYEQGNIKSSMLFNREELYNEFRKSWLNSTTKEDLYYINNDNYLKRTFLYNYFSGARNTKTYLFIENIDSINTERKKILEKIELKWNN